MWMLQLTKGASHYLLGRKARTNCEKAKAREPVGAGIEREMVISTIVK